MGMPTMLTQNGTGTSAIWTPDWMQTPFSIGIQAVAAGGAATQWSIEYTLQNLDSPLATAGSVTWLSNITNFAAATTGNISGSIIAPVKGLRINVQSATATTVITVDFVQATYGGT